MNSRQYFVFSFFMLISTLTTAQFEGNCITRQIESVQGRIHSIDGDQIVLDSCYLKKTSPGKTAYLYQVWEREGYIFKGKWSRAIIIAEVEVIARKGRKVNLRIVRELHEDVSSYNIYPVLDKRFKLGAKVELETYDVESCEQQVDYHSDGITPKEKGCNCNGIKTGTWEQFYESGELSAIVWRNRYGTIDGPVVYFYESGDTLMVGGYQSQEMYGEWREYYPNGNLRIRATYDQGRIVGPFEEFYENGVIKVQGTKDWHNDKEGVWNTYYPNGNLQSVITYDDDEMEGPYITFYENGDTNLVGSYHWTGSKEGTWRHYDTTGLLHETVQYYSGGGTRVTRFYGNGEPKEIVVFSRDQDTVGMYTEYYSNGQLKSKIEMRQVRSGKEEHYYENGQLKLQGLNFSGVKQGSWKSWYPSGQVKWDAYYSQGKFFSDYISYHPNGQISKKMFFNYEGEPQGEYLEYYVDGQLAVKGNYGPFSQMGKKVGKWIHYFENGKKKEIQYYSKDGTFIKTVSWSPDGKKTVRKTN